MFKELFIIGSLLSGGYNSLSIPTAQVFRVTNIVYTYIEEDKTYELTLLDNNNYNLVVYSGETIVLNINGTYIEREDGDVELYLDKEFLYIVSLDDVNLTFSITRLNPPIEDTKEVYFFDILDVEGGSVSIEVSREVDGVEELVESGYQKGDKVNLTLNPNIFYTVKSLNVSINETTIPLEHLENTTEWSFYLDTEGTYTITPAFVVNNELFQQFLDLYNDFKTGDLSQIFSIQNISFIVLTLIYVIYFITKIVSDHKFRKNVISDVCSTFGLNKDMTPTQISESVIRNVVVPVVDKIDKNESDIKETIEKLLICFLYMQENTPKAKQEIVKIIGAIQNKSDAVDKVADLVLKKLQDKEKLEEIKKQQVNKDIDTIKQQVNKDIENSSNQGAFDNNSLPVD